MKGDDTINITLKFIGSGLKPISIKIYEKDMLIFDGKTNNGLIKVCLKKNTGYHIIGGIYNSVIYTSQDNFLISPVCCHNQSNARMITFFLIDHFYNLPIERGEIYLG